MPLPDPSLIDSALINVLQSDATLMSLCPDGVFWDGLAPAGVQKVVLVSLPDHQDTGGLDDTDAIERHIYQVLAVVLGAGGTTARDAAARIHNLLQRATLNLTTAGYTLMALRRIRRIRYGAPDPIDTATRWQYRGGQYELTASPDSD